MRMEKQAFTLIELLVVIGIILILIGLVVPLAGSAMNKANIAAAKANLEKIEIAVRNYEASFGTYPPDLSWRFLGQKLYSRNFGIVLPVLHFEDKWKYNTDVDSEGFSRAVYKDPWGNPYLLYWVGINDINKNPGMTNTFPKTTSGSSYADYAYQSFQSLIASNRYLANKGLLHYVLAMDSNGSPMPTKLSKSFLLWSMGPDGVTGTPADDTNDDIGNWGTTRGKMM
ncbi:MAG: prepilin-type N-terminal cleavage/methylation domain-containing protein [Candidatus Aureabacteria bacterium]|nr:prepilin-type N-terminal cleavage/methylation domain-containing protein [Candidatus Auribacterota bacterium]